MFNVLLKDIQMRKNLYNFKSVKHLLLYYDSFKDKATTKYTGR